MLRANVWVRVWVRFRVKALFEVRMIIYSEPELGLGGL